MTDDSKPSEYEQKLWDYISTLESMNQTLLNIAKQCVNVLIPLKDSLPGPEELDEILDLFQETIKEVENLYFKRKAFDKSKLH